MNQYGGSVSFHRYIGFYNGPRSTRRAAEEDWTTEGGLK